MIFPLGATLQPRKVIALITDGSAAAAAIIRRGGSGMCSHLGLNTATEAGATIGLRGGLLGIIRSGPHCATTFSMTLTISFVHCAGSGGTSLRTAHMYRARRRHLHLFRVLRRRRRTPGRRQLPRRVALLTYHCVSPLGGHAHLQLRHDSSRSPSPSPSSSRLEFQGDSTGYPTGPVHMLKPRKAHMDRSGSPQ